MNAIYDGSFYGFLTALKYSIKNPTITSISKTQTLDTNITIKTEYDDKWIKEKSPYVYETLKILYLSEIKDFENIAMNYIRYLSSRDFKDIKNIFEKSVFEVERIKKRFFSELHKLKGFTRFSKIDEKTYFSKISPDNNIIEYLTNHFQKRMDEDFMIYDEKRRILSIKKDKKMQILYDIDVKYTESHEEKEIIKLWKSFFDKIEITERKNKKLQLQKVPKKYRKNIIEFNDKI